MRARTCARKLYFSVYMNSALQVLQRYKPSKRAMEKNSIYNLTHHAEVSEKEIEKHLTKRAAEIGLPCLKYSNPNMVGYPDRLVALPGGRVVWVELKSKGRKPSKIQSARIDQLRLLGHRVYVVDNKPEIDELINALKNDLPTV